MAKLLVEVDSTIGTLDLSRLCVNGDLSKYQTVQNLLNYLGGLLSGGPFRPASFALGNDAEATAASGTVTLASAQAADTVTINGVVFTAVSGTPAANQFDISGTDDDAATSLAAAINGTASALAQLVSAEAAADVVTITANEKGVIGNAYTLASSNGSRLALGNVTSGRITGGAADPDAVAFSF